MAPKGSFALLALPLELREEIYRHALVTDNASGVIEVPCNEGAVKKKSSQNVCPGLLRTNRQIHDEARKYLYANNTPDFVRSCHSSDCLHPRPVNADWRALASATAFQYCRCFQDSRKTFHLRPEDLAQFPEVRSTIIHGSPPCAAMISPFVFMAVISAKAPAKGVPSLFDEHVASFERDLYRIESNNYDTMEASHPWIARLSLTDRCVLVGDRTRWEDDTGGKDGLWILDIDIRIFDWLSNGMAVAGCIDFKGVLLAMHADESFVL